MKVTTCKQGDGKTVYLSTKNEFFKEEVKVEYDESSNSFKFSKTGLNNRKVVNAYNFRENKTERFTGWFTTNVRINKDIVEGDYILDEEESTEDVLYFDHVCNV